MPRFVVVSPYYPSYVGSGTAVRLARVLEYLRSDGARVHLVLAIRKAARHPRPPGLHQFVDRITTLDLAGRRIPGINTLHLRRATRPRSSALGRAAQWLGRWITKGRDALEIVARVVAEERPDTVWVEHTYLAPLIAKVPGEGSVLRVVDTNDVMHLRDASLRRAGLPVEAGITRHEERRLLEPFDAVIAIQNQERRVLEEMLPHKRVITVEHALETNPQPCRRKSICFVGSRYAVNTHSIMSFITRAWPAIRQRCAEARLELAGGVSRASEVEQAAVRDSRIVLRGMVPRIPDIYNGPAVIVCPLWMGSGLKIKMVEALVHGKATIGSPIASQGLEDGVGTAFFEAATPEGFVEPAIELLTDDQRRMKWEAAALRYAAWRFSPPAAYGELEQLLRDHAPEKTSFPTHPHSSSRRSPWSVSSTAGSTRTARTSITRRCESRCSAR